ANAGVDTKWFGSPRLLSFRAKGNQRMMITAAQCRSARTLLSWSVSRLASAASVSQCEIDDFELERCVPKTPTLHTIRRALEAGGMVFLPRDDVRARRRVGAPAIGAGNTTT